MLSIKKISQRLFTLNGFIHLTFALLVLSIPMQYRYHKTLRSVTKAITREGADFPAFFERMVHYCVSDILILFLVVALLCKKALSLRSLFVQQNSKYLSLYFVISIFTLIISKNGDYLLQYIRWVQLVWVGGLFYILSQRRIDMDPKTLIKRFLGLSVIAGSFQAIIACIQYFTQHAVGLRKLGEIKIGSPDVVPSNFLTKGGCLWVFDHLANKEDALNVIYRAYGTLPDPNLLGGYLVFTLLACFYLFLSSKRSAIKVILLFAIPIQFFALFITYSRSAFLGIFISGIFFFCLEAFRIKLAKNKRTESWLSAIAIQRLKVLFCVVVASCSLCVTLLYPQLLQRGGYMNYKNTSAQSADAERVIYQQIAGNIIQEHPLTGVGFNNYVLEMKEHSQQELPSYFSHPVHNIFLLIASETGLLGLLSFCLFVFGSAWSMLKKGLSSETVVLSSILLSFLFIGCCSHYFLTWQQGKLMFFMTLGLIGLLGRKESVRVLQPVESSSAVTI